MFLFKFFSNNKESITFSDNFICRTNQGEVNHDLI